MIGRFDWWPKWLENKKKYAQTDELQMDENEIRRVTVGNGLPSIHQRSTFNFHSVDDGASRFAGEQKDNEKAFAKIYTRLGNPNTEYLEKILLQLEAKYILDNALKENAETPPLGAYVFASGMGAVSTTLMGFLKSGDAIILGNVYGCTDSFARYLNERFNIDVHFADTTNTNEIESLFEKHQNIVAILLESPVNPTLEISDIKTISKITEANEALLIVDNTFATSYLQQPFRMGADIVIHSLTKYVNGHSTSIAGTAIGPFEYFSTDMFLAYKDFGATPSPFDSWLNSVNIQDLVLRVKDQSESALEVAKFLEHHPSIEKVCYPGLPSHPQYELANKQMRSGGGVLTFELKGGFDAGVKLMNHFAKTDTIMELAVSLGSVITYIEHPASMTHSVVPSEDRIERGISDGLVRLSVGAEGSKTLIEALTEGLSL